jgi:hypothetical protein
MAIIKAPPKQPKSVTIQALLSASLGDDIAPFRQGVIRNAERGM